MKVISRRQGCRRSAEQAKHVKTAAQNTMYWADNIIYCFANVMVCVYLLTSDRPRMYRPATRLQRAESWSIKDERTDKDKHVGFIRLSYTTLIHLRILIHFCVFEMRWSLFYFGTIMGIFFPCLLHCAAPLFDISIRSCHVGWPVSQQCSELKTQSCFTLNNVYLIILVQQWDNLKYLHHSAGLHTICTNIYTFILVCMLNLIVLKS